MQTLTKWKAAQQEIRPQNIFRLKHPCPTVLDCGRSLGRRQFKVKQEFTQERREIRLYGLDAPEVHFSRKMREDEAKTGIPASLLLQYGLMSLNYVLQVCPPGTRITLLTELDNRNRFLAERFGICHSAFRRMSE